VLFEKEPALRSGGYLIDFWGLGYEIAERMGVIKALRERCYEMKRMRMIDRGGHVEAQIDLTQMREMLHDRFISLARADLATALFGACDGIPSHFGVGITAIEQDETGSTATLSDGRRERFDLIVGADGLHSAVRELLFGREQRFERFLDCYVAAFRIRGYPHRDELTYVSQTMRRRQAARVSLRDDQTLVLLVCRAELIGADAPRQRAQREAVLCRAFADMGWEVPEMLEAMNAAEDLYFDRVSQIYLPRWSSGRVGLVGDAAACPSLLAGEGTGLGMLESYVLAGELHRAAGDVARALAAYEGRLRAFVTAKQNSAVWFRGFFAPDSALALNVRSLAVHAFGLPFLARPLLARALRDDLELPDYRAA
jgi:2-polyprenyl-6-methoxyphenol hydroxylase-like FAD-dependent oxidoreductase